jgi:hypothetical protein
MSESTEMKPAGRVLPHELPASLREAGLTNWIREPLDDAADRRRRVIMPPAAAVTGTPASACQGAPLARARHPVGYSCPQAYIDYFGPDYTPPDYLRREHAAARRHRWYMTSRLVTINDIYSSDPRVVADFDEFEDVVGRNFRQPEEGLGFDGSPRGAHVADDDLAQQLPVGSAGRPRRVSARLIPRSATARGSASGPAGPVAAARNVVTI